MSAWAWGISSAWAGRLRLACISRSIAASSKAIRRALVLGPGGKSQGAIEDGLGISVNFFHLDCLASEVRLNVDLDAALTVIANGCYRWLASRLNGFEKAAPKQLYRRFIATAGTVTI
jgi:hypothetical protein